MTIAIAWSFSPCKLTGKQIRPNDEITPWDGSWALVTEVQDYYTRCDVNRRYREALESFINRLP